MSSMREQAAIWTPATGWTGAAAVTQTWSTAQIAGASSTTSNLFNDTAIGDNSLYNMINSYPSTTGHAEYAEAMTPGYLPSSGAKWAVAAAINGGSNTAVGAVCADYTGTIKTATGTTPTANFTAGGTVATFANIASYSCN